MALDFQQVRKDIYKMLELAPEQREKKLSLLERALTLLREYQIANALLQDKVNRAAKLNPNFRCAVPTDEPIREGIPLSSFPDNGTTVIAADGSQINPNRHFDIKYCLVNIGAIQTVIGSSKAPIPTIKSKLFREDELENFDEGIVALIRDQRERQILARLAQETTGNVITIADGPLELWGRELHLEKTKYFKNYLAALDSLQTRGAVTGGYVDRPYSDRIVRLLELAVLNEKQLGKAGEDHWLNGITDADLYKDILQPGERTAVFRLQSLASQYYKEENSIHFFYLNVSKNKNQSHIARVDIPAWVAHNIKMLNDLHALLVEQCQIINNSPYPYVLKRADEIARVSYAEIDQLNTMIAVQMREIYRRSPKQISKDIDYF